MNLTEDRPLSRRESRRQDRRETILAVAGQSFLEHGYAGTTMSAIAAALGGSKGTLWSYFPSKPALFEAVMDEATTAFRAQLSELLDPCGELRPTLERYCVRLVTKLTSPQGIALNRLVFSEVERFPELGEIFYERGPRLTHQLTANFLEGAMDRGQLRREDPLLASRQLLSLCMIGCYQMLMVGLVKEATEAMIAKDVQHALDVFMRAYAV